MLFTVTEVVNHNVVKGMLASQVGNWNPNTAVNLLSRERIEVGGTYSFRPRNSIYKGIFIRGELDYKSERVG